MIDYKEYQWCCLFYFNDLSQEGITNFLNGCQPEYNSMWKARVDIALTQGLLYSPTQPIKYEINKFEPSLIQYCECPEKDIAY